MNKKITLIKLMIGLLLAPIFVMPGTGQIDNAFAQGRVPVPKAATEDTADTKTTEAKTGEAVDPGADLWTLVNEKIIFLRGWLSAIAVLIIIYAGILYEISAMNPSAQGTAKTILWTTISGLIFLILYPTVVGILSDGGLIPPTEIDPNTGTAT